MIDQIVAGLWNRRLTSFFCAQKPYPRQPLPLLQLGALIPQLLRLPLRKSRQVDQHGVVSMPVERDTGRNGSISVVDQNPLGTRNNRANLAVLLGQILKIVRHERLSRQLSNWLIIVRIKQYRTKGLCRSDRRHPLHKDRPPICWAYLT